MSEETTRLAATNGHAVELDFTPAGEYRGFARVERHVLPSGTVMLLRKPSIMRMVEKGQIPNPLMEVVSRVFSDRDATEDKAEADAKGLTEEELAERRTAEAEARQDDPEQTPPIPSLPGVSTEDAATFGKIIVWAAIVKPECEIAPQVDDDSPLTASGKLSIDAISTDDFRYIGAFANGELATVATFPADAERTSAGGDGGKVRDETEHVAGHPA